MNGSITIEAKETSEGARVGVETHLMGVDFADKLTLVHCLCKAVELTPHDLVVCAAMMAAGKLDGDEETFIDLGKIQKAKENMDNEGFTDGRYKDGE